MKDFLQAVVFTGAFLILFIPLMITDSMFFPYITGKNFAFRIIVEIIFASWVLLAFIDKAYRPRFSWVAVSGLALLVVMFFANLFGEYPLKSFWSNLERMDGYVTLVHFYLYFIVLAHILRTKANWSYFLHTSVAVATFVAFYGLGQSTGVIEGRNRVDSTLGNASYMAIYMLFHIFMVLWLMVRRRDVFVRALYGLVLFLFAYILLETGTRGTFIGLLTGSGVAISYLVIFGRGYPEMRKLAMGAMVVLLTLVGGFYALKDSSVIQENDALRRIANINLTKDLTVRSTIWGMAAEGFKERPLLGWGQGNFNYVFNEKYEPSLYSQEQWFDRVHNIFFDWLIAGGILGFIAYFGILISCLYYLFWRPLFKHDAQNDDTSFTVLERALILGILAGYFTHNLVVFDNIVSYMFYAVLLALVHSRVSVEIPSLTQLKVSKDVVQAVVLPIMIVAVVATVYFFHLPGMRAAQDIIVAFQSRDVDTRFEAFETALARDSFANQEITEQLAQQAMSMARQQGIEASTKEKYLRMAESQIQVMIENKPNDARLHVFFASFYRSIGQFALAQEQIDIARSLSPNKQTIILEQGITAQLNGDDERARKHFKEAYELEPKFKQARVMYAASLLGTDQADTIRDIITDEYFTAFALDDGALRAVDQAKETQLLIDMLVTRVKNRPNNAQERASLAFAYYQVGEIDKAIEALESGAEAIPSFRSLASCYVTNLETGNKPDEGCQ